MVRKTPRYYLNTCVLKAAALTIHFLNRARLLEGFKSKNRLRFERLWVEDFDEGAVSDGGAFSNYYIGYGYLMHPADLEKHLVFNENGVAAKRSDVRLDYHNPLVTAWYGLACWNHFVETADPASLEKFWVQAHFLRNWGEEKDGCFWLFYRTDFPKFKMQAPCASGLTQAVGLSLFIRAWQQSGDEAWKNLAQGTFRSLFVPVENNGVFSTSPEGFDWVEEYPGLPFDRVLNGYLFSLIGIYEHVLAVENSPENRRRLHRLTESLFKSIHLYLFGKFAKYSLGTWQFGNVEYQGLMVWLLLHLHFLSGKKAFLHLAERFERHVNWADFYSFFNIGIEEHKRVRDFYKNFLEK